MNNLKKVNKILAFTLLILSVLVLADYSKSASRYYKDKDSIVFDSNLLRLYYDTGDKRIDFSILTDRSSLTNVVYRYSFDRNIKAYTADELIADPPIGEEYRIVVDETCTIQSVTTAEKTYNLPDDIANEYTVRFDTAPKDKERVHVDYTCPVQESNERVETNVKIYEKIDGDYTDFLYLNYPNSIRMIEYKKLIGITDEAKITWKENQMLVPKGTEPEKIKAAVRKWMWDYIDWYENVNKDNEDLQKIVIEGGPLHSHTDEFNNPLEKFFYDEFGDFKDLTKTLPGLDVTSDLTNVIPGLEITSDDSLLFTLDDKFIGYALTDYHYMNPSKVFYFSNDLKNKEETEKLFDYYVDKYMPDDKEAVNAYITKIGGIYDFITGKKVVNPMIMMYDGGRLLFMPHFLKDPALVTWTSGYEKDEANRLRRIFSTIYSQMSEMWPDEFKPFGTDGSIYTTVNDTFSGSHFAYNVANVQRENITYNDYLVYHIGQRYILINVYNADLNNDGVKETYAKVDELVDGFNYDGATTVAYMTSTVGKEPKDLVDEVKEYSQKLDLINSTNYTGSITADLLSKTDRTKGIQRMNTFNFLLVTFINTIDASNKYSITPIPTTPGVMSSPALPEQPSADASATENNGNTTNNNSSNTTTDNSSNDEQKNDNQSPDDQQQNTTQPVKKENDEVEPPKEPEPEANGEGGDDN